MHHLDTAIRALLLFAQQTNARAVILPRNRKDARLLFATITTAMRPAYVPVLNALIGQILFLRKYSKNSSHETNNRQSTDKNPQKGKSCKILRTMKPIQPSYIECTTIDQYVKTKARLLSIGLTEIKGQTTLTHQGTNYIKVEMFFFTLISETEYKNEME